MPKKPDRWIEGLLLPVISITALLLSLTDVFGFFPFLPTSRIPALTLSIVSLVLTSLMFIQRRSTEIQEQTQRLLSRMVLEQMTNEVIEQIDPALRKVFKDDYFKEVIGFLLTAVKESKVQVNDITRVRYYYIRTLRQYSKATFLSTQCLSSFNLWDDPVIEEATASFIKAGGKVERIVFVKDASELDSEQVEKTIERQRKIGVRVHIINSAVIPADLKKNFIVESRGRIAWDIHADNSEHIRAMVTTNKQLATSYYHNFEKLRESKVQK
jgi:hypothetical protein